MSLRLDPACQAALDSAKRAVAERHELDAGGLLAALYHGTGLKDRFPQLARLLEPPRAVHGSAPAKVPVAENLQPVFQQLADRGQVVTPEMLFAALIDGEAGRRYLISRGLRESELSAIAEGLGASAYSHAPADSAETASGWRASSERSEAINALSSYGRTLTATDPPYKGVAGMEAPLQALVRTLSKMGRKNAIITGFPGTGKSALVYEFARRLFQGHESIPPRLRDCDVFELSPSFLRSGASMVGQYDERIKALIEVLRAHPKIILFIDEIHSLFHSGIHEKGPFSEANESFKGVLGRGEITCIGCTTTADYRHYLEPDRAFARRFAEIRIEPPSAQSSVAILSARLPRLVEYYAPLRIPSGILARVVELTDDYLPARYQPDKSIQLLDEACAYCVTARPPADEVTEEALWRALEDMIGHSIARTGNLTEEGVFEELRAKILGQDETLRHIARAFVGGLGGWTKGSGPRGVFFFCGPTGVGKTETALSLGRLLGGGKEALVRVDCNALQGSGHDSSPAVNRLLGAPPGYIGYARGQGGILSRVRDMPESIVLFDEIEKADPGVSKLLLQILDDGRLEDVDGNLLDFRRSFIVFTTNAGCLYDRKHIGFEEGPQAGDGSPRVDLELLKSELRALGYGEEFLGRISHFFVFQGLAGDAIRDIIQLQLRRLGEAAVLRGYRLDWGPELVAHLSSQWQPRFGIRHLTAILRNRITEQLGVAEAQGDLKGVTEIRLRTIPAVELGGYPALAGSAMLERQGGALIISLT